MFLGVSSKGWGGEGRGGGGGGGSRHFQSLFKKLLENEPKNNRCFCLKP